MLHTRFVFEGPMVRIPAEIVNKIFVKVIGNYFKFLCKWENTSTLEKTDI
jgi:hypothetical protein